MISPKKNKWLEFLSAGPFTFFDIETTGMSPLHDRIIEIGAIRCEKDGSENIFSSLVNPEIKVKNLASHIHNITWEQLCSAPIFRKIAPDFLEFCKNSTLVAHNARFDLAFLQESLKRENLPLWNGKTIDSITFIKIVKKDLVSYSLEYLAEFFKIETTTSFHRALNDAKILKHIFQRLLSS